MPKPAGKLLLNSLDANWRDYRLCVNTTRRACSETAIHDLRLAIRRLLALLELCRKLSPDPGLDKLRQQFKAQLDRLDALRDTQVMRLEISGQTNSLPELTAFLHQLHLQELQLLQETAAFIRHIPLGIMKRKLKNARHRCQTHLAGKAVNAEILAVIDDIYHSALQRYQLINPAELSSLHHLRISLKKLRYLLTDLTPLLSDLDNKQLPAIKDYLSLLGDIQNSAVLHQALADFYPQSLPAAVAEYYHAQQQALLNRFMQNKQQIFEFWRTGG